MTIRLSALPTPAKLTLTAFLALVGVGYLAAVAKINIWHNDADGTPGMSPNDLKAIYHGLDVTVTAQAGETLASHMLREVSPGGKMHKHLAKGGEPAERALIAWLKDGAKQATFDKAGLVQPVTPRPSRSLPNAASSATTPMAGKRKTSLTPQTPRPSLSMNSLPSRQLPRSPRTVPKPRHAASSPSAPGSCSTSPMPISCPFRSSH